MSKALWHKTTELVVVCLVIAAGIFFPSQTSAAEQKFTVNAPSAVAGGVWFVGIGAIGQEFLKEYPGSQYNLLVGGAVSNILRLEKGQDAEFSIAQSIHVNLAMKGIAPFKQPVQKVRAIANLRDVNRLQIVGRADLDIETFDDIVLKKKPLRIATGPLSAGTEGYFRQICTALGIKNDKDFEAWGAKIFRNGYGDMGAMLKDGHVDLVLWTGPGEVAFLQETVLDMKLRWIPLSDNLFKTMEQFGVKRGVTPPNLYNGALGQNNACLENPGTLLTRADVSDELAYALTKVVCERWDAVVAAYPVWSSFVPEKGWEGTGVPLHPGAEKYYRERGWLK